MTSCVLCVIIYVVQEEGRIYMQGVKGTKALRINMAFDDDVYRYIRLMSKIKGMTMTEFVNDIVAKDMKGKSDYLNSVEALVNLAKD